MPRVYSTLLTVPIVAMTTTSVAMLGNAEVLVANEMRDEAGVAKERGYDTKWSPYPPTQSIPPHSSVGRMVNTF